MPNTDYTQCNQCHYKNNGEYTKYGWMKVVNCDECT